MRSSLFIALLISVVMLSECTSRNHSTEQASLTSNPPHLIVYGSRSCSHCIHFISQMDSAGVKYDFRAVDKDTAMFHEMMIKIHKADIKGYISYPVVDVNGTILVHPPIGELMKYLK